MRDNERDADLIEQIERRLGMGHAAWDTIDPLEIAAAFREALAAPADGVDVEGLWELVRDMQLYRSASLPLLVGKAGEWQTKIESLIDAAGGAKDMRDAYEGAREDLLDWKGRAQRAERTLRGLGYTGIDASEAPQPAEGDGALAARLESHQTNYSANMDKDAYDALSQAIAILKSRPAATAQVAASWDTRALDVARLFTHASETQRRANLQCAVLDAMRWAAAPAAPKGGVDGFDAWFDEYSKQNYDDYMLARAAWDAAPKGGVVDEAMVDRAAVAFAEVMQFEDRWPDDYDNDQRRDLLAGLTAALAAALNPEPQS